MNIHVVTEVYNHTEQKLLIQPTPEFDGIEVYIKEVDGESNSSGAFYINKEELTVIIKKLQEMMEYTLTK